MDFNDTPEEAAWRAEFRGVARGARAAGRGRGRPNTTWRSAAATTSSAAKRWQAMKFDAGLARITWEPEFGGRNGTTVEQIIFGQEEAPVPRARTRRSSSGSG